MDPRSGGAATLLGALNEACEIFQEYGRRMVREHGPLQWELIGRFGPGDVPYALVGTVFRIAGSTVDLGVDVWVRDGVFEVSGYATVDGRRLVVDLPDVLTEDVDEAVTALRRYTERLCTGLDVLEAQRG
jgi:hypothetical protein